MLYSKWKKQIRETHPSLKNECSNKDLCAMMDAFEEPENQGRKLTTTTKFTTFSDIHLDSCPTDTNERMLE